MEKIQKENEKILIKIQKIKNSKNPKKMANIFWKRQKIEKPKI